MSITISILTLLTRLLRSLSKLFKRLLFVWKQKKTRNPRLQAFAFCAVNANDVHMKYRFKRKLGG